MAGRRGWFSGLTGRQAAATLVVAVALGGLGSAVELVVDWRAHRDDAARTTRQVLDMMRGPAEEAAYQLDPGLARQVADGLLSIGQVARVAITDDYGGVLAAAERSQAGPPGRLAAWLFGDVAFYRQEMARDGRPLGRLEVALSPDRLADGFFARALVNAASGLLRALAICAVVAALFAWMVTRPIVRLGQDVAQVDPAAPARRLIQTPKGRENDEIGDLAAALNALLTAFQHSLDERDQAQAENMRLSAEIDISRRLQRMVLPTQDELDAVPGLDVAAYMEPAAEVGGDYYDVLRGADGKVRIGIGDVTGHGLESGAVMLMTQSAVRSLATRQAEPDDGLLTSLNRMMFDNLKRMGSDRNVTLALIEYQPAAPCAPAALPGAHPVDFPAGRLRVTGQHEAVLVIRVDGAVEVVDTLELGMPLGLVDDISSFVGVAEVGLRPGDVVVLYTDGITEAADPQHRLFGLERLCETARAARAGSADEIKQAVLDAVADHIGVQPIWDDLTLLVLKQR